MNRKKVLVCGATGFIGRSVAERFLERQDFEVYATYLNSKPWSHPKIKMVKTDLTDKNAVNDIIKGMDIIVQAAATTSGAKDIVTRPYYHVTDNVVMNALIFRAAYEQKVSHVVFFSCTTMYQPGPSAVKESDFDANSQMNPNYFGGGWTKVYNEKMCEFYSRIGAAKFTVIRHSNIYGPYDKFDTERSHVFGATITKVMNAEEGGKVLVWGSGEEKRDLLYVQDIVTFTEKALERQASKFEIFNAGLGSAISIRELVEKIIRHSGKRLGTEYDITKPTIKTSLYLDIGKAGKLLGWSPAVSLDEGIQKTIRWYKDNVMTKAHVVC